MKNFIEQANRYGREKRPFLFLIDFEQNAPLICPLEQAQASGLFFDFFNQNGSFSPIGKPFELTRFPLDKSRYRQGFDEVQRGIRAGNSYLLNLTYPTEIRTNYSLAEIYQSTRAKYKLYRQDHFVCFSPETFVRIADNTIYSYPMKGTINADLPNAERQLLDSAKEKAEHNTIVDLIRNDLALVAHNIRVSRYRYVEKVQTHRGAIFQTSSEICGDMADGWQQHIGTLLAKLLPAGSISGAPKVKTVEIIRAAELGARGYYTGVFGLFDGENMESAVAIRYIEQQNGKMWFRSGGGITALSNADDEYQELLEKVYVPISPV